VTSNRSEVWSDGLYVFARRRLDKHARAAVSSDPRSALVMRRRAFARAAVSNMGLIAGDPGTGPIAG
jgi:hypothetical protein